MFKKAFKLKSHTQIKGSERKNLRDVLLKTFTTLTESDIEAVWSKKEMGVVSKVLTANNKPVLVYSVEKRALFFNIDGVFLPTVYLLWRLPKIGIGFMTNDFVVSKIVQGADLMLPGVINNPAKTEVFSHNQIAFVNSISNKAAVAVGLTVSSSAEMRAARGGKCVIIYHSFGDKLCTMDDMPLLQIPHMGAEEAGRFEIEDQDDFPSLWVDDAGASCSGTASALKNLEEPMVEVTDKSSLLVPHSQEEVSETELMDRLLTHCFFAAIKYSKTLELPILTSSFYKIEMLPNCPEGNTLDIKKSSFKKLGQFLKHMEKEGLIVIKEKKKGVETIDLINKEHQKFLDFYMELDSRPKKPIVEETETRNIVESYAVTQKVAPIFKEFGYNKGSTVTAQEARRLVTDYVKRHNLQDESNKRFVLCTDTNIKTLCKNERAVTWEDLFEQVLSSMTSCFKISDGQEETVNKGKLQPIAMTVQTRSGNKKVTIVDNLELYHIRMSEFAKECQHGVAASTSVSRVPGKKSDQILIQGNQVLFVYNLLIDKYKIPKKYIRGLENAPKKK